MPSLTLPDADSSSTPVVSHRVFCNSVIHDTGWSKNDGRRSENLHSYCTVTFIGLLYFTVACYLL